MCHSRLTLVNLWELMGYDVPPSPTEFRSTLALLVHPDDQERVRREYEELLASDRQEYESKHRVRRKDGSTRWNLARGTVLRSSNGKPVRFIGTSTDITELKRAEEALRESEQRWRSLTEALPQLVWSATSDGTCDYFSSQWTEHTGVAEAELLGWQWLDTLHPDDREPTRRFWLESVAGHHSYDIQYRVRHRDGEYRWFKTRGVPIRDTGGNIVKWFGTCTDITELRDSEGRFRGIFENAAVGIAQTHPSGRFLRVNEKFCSIVGYTREELLQKTFKDITHPDNVAIGVSALAALLRGEALSIEHEKRYVRKDGSTVWAELFVSLQRDAAGEPAYAVAVIQDISERKRLDVELRQAKDAAEAANRAKDEFLANVSHEIRTPMNAIIGMTELVLDTPLDEGQRQGLKTVKSAADSLLGIINDLLDFSKIEAGKLELVPGDFSLRGAVGDTLRALAVRAHKKGLELIYQVEPDVPDALIGDAGRVRQVLLNLVGNAVKFTDEGEVVVRVEVISDQSSVISDQSSGPSSLITDH
jgi:PAS domain S-box-containing protein